MQLNNIDATFRVETLDFSCDSKPVEPIGIVVKIEPSFSQRVLHDTCQRPNQKKIN